MPIVLPPMPFAAKLKVWHDQQTRLGRITIGLIVGLVLCFVFGVLLGVVRGLAMTLALLFAVPLSVCLLLLLLRWFSRHLLWSVRNRLLLTFLILGVAPIVLLSSLGAVALYLFAGQYATNTALIDFDEAVKAITVDATSAVNRSRPYASDNSVLSRGVTVSVLHQGNWQPLNVDTANPLARSNEAKPTWLNTSFHGIVERDGRLYLCALDTTNTTLGVIEALGSRPLDDRTLGSLDQSLGMLRIFCITTAKMKARTLTTAQP